MLAALLIDISCSRLCSTVVLAHVSPLARDVSHSLNTLQYAAPLRVPFQLNDLSKLQRDERDPALWSRDQALNVRIFNIFMISGYNDNCSSILFAVF